MTVSKPAASTLAGTVVYLQNCKTKNPVLVIIIMGNRCPSADEGGHMGMVLVGSDLAFDVLL